MIAIPRTDRDIAGHYRTSYDGDEAIWCVSGGVIHVNYWFSIDGGDLHELQWRPLGECFDHMPRRLWDEVRHAYEHRRDDERRAARST